MENILICSLLCSPLTKNIETMEGNLVIVESPAKAGRIQSFLGKDYIVKSSYGHIRDLQDKKLSVDIEHGFSPEYVVPSDKKKVVTELKKLAEKADTVWLASDADREGEAISWHLFETLGLKKENTKRIVSTKSQRLPSKMRSRHRGTLT